MENPDKDSPNRDLGMLDYDFKAHITQLMNSFHFQQLCQKYFSFLVEEYSCHIEIIKDEDYVPDYCRGYGISFWNSAISIKCYMIFIECIPSIYLKEKNSEAHEPRGFNICDFLRVLGCGCPPIGKIPLDNEAIEKLIKEYAEGMRPWIAEVMKEDSSLFARVEAMVNEEYTKVRHLFPERFSP